MGGVAACNFSKTALVPSYIHPDVPRSREHVRAPSRAVGSPRTIRTGTLEWWWLGPPWGGLDVEGCQRPSLRGLLPGSVIPTMSVSLSWVSGTGLLPVSLLSSSAAPPHPTSLHLVILPKALLYRSAVACSEDVIEEKLPSPCAVSGEGSAHTGKSRRLDSLPARSYAGRGSLVALLCWVADVLS